MCLYSAQCQTGHCCPKLALRQTGSGTQEVNIHYPEHIVLFCTLYVPGLCSNIMNTLQIPQHTLDNISLTAETLKGPAGIIYSCLVKSHLIAF